VRQRLTIFQITSGILAIAEANVLRNGGLAG